MCTLLFLLVTMGFAVVVGIWLFWEAYKLDQGKMKTRRIVDNEEKK